MLWLAGGVTNPIHKRAVPTSVSAALTYGGHYLIAWGPALWCGIRCYGSLRRYAALKKLLRPSPLRPKPPPAGEASASGAPRQTQPRPTGRQAPAPRPGNIQHALQHAGKSSLEPALGTIIVLIGVVGLAIAGYFFALAGDRSNSSITKSATVDSSPSATPRINVNTAAGSPKEACIKSVQASPGYSLPAGAAFTDTRNVLTTKSGLTQWSVQDSRKPTEPLGRT